MGDRAEVQPVGDARMYHAEDGQHEDAHTVDGNGREVHRQQVVGQQHDGGDTQLHDGDVVGADVAGELGQQHDAGVHHRCAGGQQHAAGVPVTAATALNHAGGEHHAHQCDQHEDAAAQCQLFLQDKGGDQHHHYRGEIVEHRRHRHGGIAIRLEEEHPVKAHDDTHGNEDLQIGANGLEIELFLL